MWLSVLTPMGVDATRTGNMKGEHDAFKLVWAQKGPPSCTMPFQANKPKHDDYRRPTTQASPRSAKTKAAIPRYATADLIVCTPVQFNANAKGDSMRARRLNESSAQAGV